MTAADGLRIGRDEGEERDESQGSDPVSCADAKHKEPITLLRRSRTARLGPCCADVAEEWRIMGTDTSCRKRQRRIRSRVLRESVDSEIRNETGQTGHGDSRLVGSERFG